MISVLAFLKAKLSGTVAIVLAILAGLVWHKRVVRSRDAWRERAQHAEADIEFQDDVDESDAEIAAATDIRAQDIADELEAGEPVDSLTRPNEW